MKKAAVIHDLSGFGKCSLTAAIPVLSALGVQCCPVATAVLTGQTGYPCYHCTDLTAMLPDYIDAWGKNNAHFDAIYSGFLTGAEQISQVLDFIRQFREEHTLLLVDPVMGDDGNAYPFFTPGLLNGMKELTLEADVITPNLTEACLLADIPEDALLHCRTVFFIIIEISLLCHGSHFHTGSDTAVSGIYTDRIGCGQICRLSGISFGLHICNVVCRCIH